MNLVQLTAPRSHRSPRNHRRRCRARIAQRRRGRDRRVGRQGLDRTRARDHRSPGRHWPHRGSHWLGDVAPHLLTCAQREGLRLAKERAAQRERIEAIIPKHLLYAAGWPTVMPTPTEAELLASVRRDVAALLGVDVACTTAQAVTARYAELMAAKEARS